MQNLNNRIALVTGGSRGIGAAIAVALARAGADVAVNYRERAEAAQEVCAAITRLGRRAFAVKADVSVSADVRRMVAEVESHFGSVDILVNNAGIARPQKLDEITDADWDEILAVNLKSVFLVTQAVVGGMRQRKWGRIINLSSVAAQTGGAVGAHYAASKAGMIGLTHSCAAAFVKEGITVNAIAPALIETEMVTSNLNATPQLIPMGHFGSVDDVSSVAVMLAMNDYMTGQTISVNGGWYMT
jgi:3-oxoacyl-[acyl-carrier protein] reductase